jgi:hypothetical protein
VAHASRGRRVWWLAGLFLVVAVAPLFLWGRDVLRPLRRMIPTRLLNPVSSPGAAPTSVPVEEATLDRRRRGLAALVAQAEAGALFPDASDRVLVLVDQGLIQRLLTALTPSEHIVDDRYRVVVTGARVVFDDGFALVRLDGRASLAGVAEADVFADLTVLGDLDIPVHQERRTALKARIHVLAVDARLVEVLAPSRRAEALVEELGRTRLEAFAALASSLEIPVRQEHEINIPAVGPEGPVRIAAASVPVHLSLSSVRAFHGKLWISMGVATGTPHAAPSAPAPTSAASTEGPDLRGLSRDERMVRLHEEYRRLRERFEALLAREPLVGQTERMGGDMVVAVREGFVKKVAEEAAQRYFDRVALDLSGIEVSESGEVHADTFLGRVNAGRWTLNVTLLHVRGLLRARAPRIELKEGNEVALALAVLLEEGHGTATVRFTWKSRGVAKIVCRSFETRQEISGRIKPDEYPVKGSFVLAAAKNALVSTPRFDPAFRVNVELNRESWARVRAQLEAQDDITRCGLGFDPDQVFGRLQELVGKGFVVRLPRKLLRPVTLPAGITQSVEVQGRQVGLAVTQDTLRIAPEGLWYSIGISAHIPGAPRPGAFRTPRP